MDVRIFIRLEVAGEAAVIIGGVRGQEYPLNSALAMHMQQFVSFVPRETQGDIDRMSRCSVTYPNKVAQGVQI